MNSMSTMCLAPLLPLEKKMMKNTNEVPVLMAFTVRSHLWERKDRGWEMKENISLVYIVSIFHIRNEPTI